MATTDRPDRFYWHLVVLREDGRFILRLKTGFDRIDLTKYLLPT